MILETVSTEVRGCEGRGDLRDHGDARQSGQLWALNWSGTLDGPVNAHLHRVWDQHITTTLHGHCSQNHVSEFRLVSPVCQAKYLGRPTMVMLLDESRQIHELNDGGCESHNRQKAQRQYLHTSPTAKSRLLILLYFLRLQAD
jgi:hypothetical protein